MWIGSDGAQMCRYLVSVSSHRAFHVAGMEVTRMFLVKQAGRETTRDQSHQRRHNKDEKEHVIMNPINNQ